MIGDPRALVIANIYGLRNRLTLSAGLRAVRAGSKDYSGRIIPCCPAAPAQSHVGDNQSHDHWFIGRMSIRMTSKMMMGD
jgi:hypothetical protein